MTYAKNLFTTKTFQGATLTLVSSLGLIIISCSYDHRWLTKQEAITTFGLLVGYAWTLIGRGRNTPTYTPDYLPGANQSDFEK